MTAQTRQEGRMAGLEAGSEVDVQRVRWSHTSQRGRKRKSRREERNGDFRLKFSVRWPWCGQMRVVTQNCP